MVLVVEGGNVVDVLVEVVVGKVVDVVEVEVDEVLLLVVDEVEVLVELVEVEVLDEDVDELVVVGGVATATTPNRGDR